MSGLLAAAAASAAQFATATPAVAAARLFRPVGPEARLVNGFGPRPRIWADGGWTSGFHGGVDWAADGSTFPIYAAGDGVVVASAWDWTAGDYPVTIHHPDVGVYSGYAHMRSRTVIEGAQVSAGQLIGMAGDEGRATGIHLHFEIITIQPGSPGWYGSRVDPLPYINDTAAPVTPGPTPTPEDFVTKTLLYRKPNGWVFVCNLATGLFYPVPDVGTLELVRQMPGFLDSPTVHDVSDHFLDYMSLIVTQGTNGAGNAQIQQFAAS